MPLPSNLDLPDIRSCRTPLEQIAYLHAPTTIIQLGPTRQRTHQVVPDPPRPQSLQETPLPPVLQPRLTTPPNPLRRERTLRKRTQNSPRTHLRTPKQTSRRTLNSPVRQYHSVILPDREVLFPRTPNYTPNHHPEFRKGAETPSYLSFDLPNRAHEEHNLPLKNPPAGRRTETRRGLNGLFMPGTPRALRWRTGTSEERSDPCRTR